MKKIFSFLIMLSLTLFSGVNARKIQKIVSVKKTVYVFATFSGDKGDEMKLQIYTSTDGLNFQLYSNTGFAGPAGRSLRDPSIMKHTDGKYYVVFTSPPYNNPYANESIVGLASSEDLKTWTSLPSVSTANIGGGVKLSWAPEWVVDGTKTPKFIIHCSSQSSDLKPYLFTAIDSVSLIKWSAPTEIGIGAVHLDGQIIKHNGLYHCFIKDVFLEHATASSITGPWTWQPNKTEWKDMEGPAAVRLSDNTWRMYVDPMYGPAAYMNSLDLYNWSSPVNLPNPAGAVIKHGTVILDTAFVADEVEPVNPGIANLTHQWSFDDGTAKDLVGTANGTLNGGATIADGVLKTEASGQYLELPANLLGLTTYPALSFEVWFKSKTGANTGNTMLCYMGDTQGGKGDDGCFVSVARADNTSRASISCGNTTAPWNSESYAGSAEMDDGLLHQAVGVISSADISFYVDGVKQTTSALTVSNSLSNIILNYAYLAKSGYTADPTWLGTIDKFSLYNKALSDEEVLYLYRVGSHVSTSLSTPLKKTVSIYPSIAKNLICFKSPDIIQDGIFKLISMTGQQVYSRHIANMQQGQFDISTIPTGIYVAQVFDSRLNTSSLIVKK